MITANFLTSSADKNPYIGRLAGGVESAGVSVRFLGFNALFLRRLLRSPRPAVLHVHWVHPFVVARGRPRALAKYALFRAQVFAARALGFPIVWTAHNLKDHDGEFARMDAKATQAVADAAGAVVAHCERAKAAVVESFGLRDPGRVAVIPHGHYADDYPNDGDRGAARAELGVAPDAPTFLFLGNIRPYKGVLSLVEAFRALDRPDARLLIAGRPFAEGDESSVRDGIGGDERIDFRPGFVDRGAVQTFMNAADFVVLPYRAILTSGAALLAMSFARACVAPRLGCLAETLDDQGAVLYDPEDPGALRDALGRALERLGEARRMGEHNASLAAAYDWERIGRRTADLYRSLLGADGPRARGA